MIDRSRLWTGTVSTALLLAFTVAACGETEGVAHEETPESVPAEESLYERLGGLEAIALVVDDFMAEFSSDPLILENPAVRERKTGEHVPYVTYQVTTLVCEATGGPCQYTGKEMGPAHEGLNVSPEEWDRMAEIFSATLNRHGVPEQEQNELFEILGPARDDIVVTDEG